MPQKTKSVVCSLVPHAAFAVLMLAGAAAGQDSFSKNVGGGNGLPGDALSPWSGPVQKVSYVADLREFTTASGVRFGIAPIMKSGRTNANRFTAFNGASSISQTAKTAAYPSTSYTLWTNGAGGVNATDNDTALNSSLIPTGSATVFGVGFMDFDEVLVTATNIFVNQVYGGLIAFDPANPTRLYVTRINGAVNAGLTATDRSQFGYGGIDADGNLCFRADSFGSGGPATALLVGDNYFRIKLPLRGLTANVIDNSGGTNVAATDWVMQRNTVTHTTPSCIPADLAGRSVVVGADFVGNDRFESAALTMSSTAAHRPNTLDHRGGIGVSGKPIFAGSIATGGVLTRSSAGTGKTDSLSIFGVNASGAVTTARTLTMPAALTDSCDSFQWPLGGGDFRNYDSQVTFRGGSAPVATAKDKNGLALAAAVLYNGTIQLAANPFNAIAAVRFDPANANSTPEWTTIAWVNSTAVTGKDIYGDFGADGVAGTADAGEGDGVIDMGAGISPIGRIAAMNELGTGLNGPSLSAPAFDSAGNAYFLASVALRKRVGPQNPFDFKLALIRGVYNPASFCYTLDLVLEAGQVFHGSNSNRNYQISALNLADNDSISSASVWSGSATQQAWNNIDVTSLASAAPQNLGGLVLSARVVYDTNNDAMYKDPTAIGGDTASVDEGYNVVLYIGNTTPPPYCPADYNMDGGIDGQDIEAFFIDWSAGNAAADVNLDGGIDGQDVETFFIAWENGGC